MKEIKTTRSLIYFTQVLTSKVLGCNSEAGAEGEKYVLSPGQGRVPQCHLAQPRLRLSAFPPPLPTIALREKQTHLQPCWGREQDRQFTWAAGAPAGTQLLLASAVLADEAVCLPLAPTAAVVPLSENSQQLPPRPGCIAAADSPALSPGVKEKHQCVTAAQALGLLLRTVWKHFSLWHLEGKKLTFRWQRN